VPPLFVIVLLHYSWSGDGTGNSQTTLLNEFGYDSIIFQPMQLSLIEIWNILFNQNHYFTNQIRENEFRKLINTFQKFKTSFPSFSLFSNAGGLF